MNAATAIAGQMPTELRYLAWSVVLVLVQLLLQSSTASLELGLPYAMGPRDEGLKPKNVYVGRVARALQNLLETYVVFVALALALAVSDKSGGWGATGAQVWLWARVAYVPLLVAGIPVVRTLVWAVSMIGLIMMLVQLFS